MTGDLRCDIGTGSLRCGRKISNSSSPVPETSKNHNADGVGADVIRESPNDPVIDSFRDRSILSGQSMAFERQPDEGHKLRTSRRTGNLCFADRVLNEL